VEWSRKTYPEKTYTAFAVGDLPDGTKLSGPSISTNFANPPIQEPDSKDQDQITASSASKAQQTKNSWIPIAAGVIAFGLIAATIFVVWRTHKRGAKPGGFQPQQIEPVQPFPPHPAQPDSTPPKEETKKPGESQ
jgi:hypothetical protein